MSGLGNPALDSELHSRPAVRISYGDSPLWNEKEILLIVSAELPIVEERSAVTVRGAARFKPRRQYRRDSRGIRPKLNAQKIRRVVPGRRCISDKTKAEIAEEITSIHVCSNPTEQVAIIPASSRAPTLHPCRQKYTRQSAVRGA